ncbi:MAG: peptide deformylase [Deltaproteobacteria bacterium]|nr:peptide deformylase [Deltaproteobacteria bacterium]
MAILSVARMGHPILRRKAKPVDPMEIRTKEFQSLVDDMVETMRDLDGVGLAAPQVYRSIRLAVVELTDDNPRYPENGGAGELSGLQVFINPKITKLTRKKARNWEGCLSVPGLRGLVARPDKVRVKYLDREGKSRTRVVEGFLAIVLQHEFDHLDGVLYVDRLVDSKFLVFEEEFEKHVINEVDSEAAS